MNGVLFRLLLAFVVVIRRRCSVQEIMLVNCFYAWPAGSARWKKQTFTNLSPFSFTINLVKATKSFHGLIQLFALDDHAFVGQQLFTHFKFQVSGMWSHRLFICSISSRWFGWRGDRFFSISGSQVFVTMIDTIWVLTFLRSHAPLIKSRSQEIEKSAIPFSLVTCKNNYTYMLL